MNFHFITPHILFIRPFDLQNFPLWFLLLLLIQLSEKTNSV